MNITGLSKTDINKKAIRKAEKHLAKAYEAMGNAYGSGSYAKYKAIGEVLSKHFKTDPAG